MVKTGRRHTFPFIHLCGCSSWARKESMGGGGSEWKKRLGQRSFQGSGQRECVQEAVYCHIVNLDSIIHHHQQG